MGEFCRARFVVAASVLAIGLSAQSAAADEPSEKKADEIAVMGSQFDPLTSPDATVTDEMESQAFGSAATCRYENVVSSPNAQPASPSFQLLYVVPYDQRPTDTLDRPQSCSDGTFRHSATARASRNFATWQDRRGAVLHYRTLGAAYTHDYTGSTQTTRSVRRFTSNISRWNWDDYPVMASDGSSPRLSKMAAELGANGFNVSSTRYGAVLHAAATEYSCTGTGCYYYVGAAQIAGKYSLSVRVYPNAEGNPKKPEQPVRYGCAKTEGDAYLGHELTHQAGAADHVYDANDLMLDTKPKGVSLYTSPYLLWDVGRDDYHPTVRGSVYVERSSLPGSYFTC